MNDLTALHLHDHAWVLREGGLIAPRLVDCVSCEPGKITEAWNHYNPECGRAVSITHFGAWSKAVRFDRLKATWLWFSGNPYLINRACRRCRDLLTEAMGALV